MEHILKSWAHTVRFLIIIAILFSAIFYFTSRLSDKTQFNIDYTNDKTLITIIDKKNVIANSVLPSCDCWSNTGIEIRPGEEYEIKVSGKIHTVADKVIKDAEEDVKPRFSWIGPEGADNFRIREDKRYHSADSIRKTLLLCPKARLGQVLFYFQKKNDQRPDCDLGLSFFNPAAVFMYESEKGLKGVNDTKETWLVWATVNDMLIRDFQQPSGRIAYLGGAIKDTFKRKSEHWEELKKENYNRIWFDDNFGDFVISAKILKPVNFFGF